MSLEEMIIILVAILSQIVIVAIALWINGISGREEQRRLREKDRAEVRLREENLLVSKNNADADRLLQATAMFSEKMERIVGLHDDHQVARNDDHEHTPYIQRQWKRQWR